MSGPPPTCECGAAATVQPTRFGKPLAACCPSCLLRDLRLAAGLPADDTTPRDAEDADAGGDS